MSRRTNFRPTLQKLETRRYMAGDVALNPSPVDEADTSTHQYATGGIFTITVTVVDDDTGHTPNDNAGSDQFFFNPDDVQSLTRFPSENNDAYFQSLGRK